MTEVTSFLQNNRTFSSLSSVFTPFRPLAEQQSLSWITDKCSVVALPHSLQTVRHLCLFGRTTPERTVCISPILWARNRDPTCQTGSRPKAPITGQPCDFHPTGKSYYSSLRATTGGRMFGFCPFREEA